MDVGDWPRSLGLGESEVAFRESGIDNRVLSKLTSQDFKELGVAALVGRVVQNEVLYTVVPAQAGIQGRSMCGQVWMPAFAGMTLVSPRRPPPHFERLGPLGIVGRSCRRSGSSRVRPERLRHRRGRDTIVRPAVEGRRQAPPADSHVLRSRRLDRYVGVARPQDMRDNHRGLRSISRLRGLMPEYQ
jgi:hypothetical protein